MSLPARLRVLCGKGMLLRGLHCCRVHHAYSVWRARTLPFVYLSARMRMLMVCALCAVVLIGCALRCGAALQGPIEHKQAWQPTRDPSEKARSVLESWCSAKSCTARLGAAPGRHCTPLKQIRRQEEPEVSMVASQFCAIRTRGPDELFTHLVVAWDMHVDPALTHTLLTRSAFHLPSILTLHKALIWSQ